MLRSLDTDEINIFEIEKFRIESKNTPTALAVGVFCYKNCWIYRVGMISGGMGQR